MDINTRYFVSYEAAITVTVEDCQEVRTFKNSTEVLYPAITSYSDIEVIEDMITNQITALYADTEIPAEILYVTILHYIRFEDECNTIQ